MLVPLESEWHLFAFPEGPDCVAPWRLKILILLRAHRELLRRPP